MYGKKRQSCGIQTDQQKLYYGMGNRLKLKSCKAMIYALVHEDARYLLLK